MIRLYKIIDNTHYYWEAYEPGEDMASFHYGVLGDQGKTDNIKAQYPDTVEGLIKREMDAKKKLGFTEFPEEKYFTIAIRFRNKGLSKANQRWLDSTEAIIHNRISWYGYGESEGWKEEGDYIDLYCRVVETTGSVKLVRNVLRFNRAFQWKGISIV